jgi:hypothetical protein
MITIYFYEGSFQAQITVVVFIHIGRNHVPAFQLKTKELGKNLRDGSEIKWIKRHCAKFQSDMNLAKGEQKRRILGMSQPAGPSSPEP